MNDPFESENRKFLHDIATPISILKLLLKKMAAIADGTCSDEDKGRLPELTERAKKNLETLENIHADFKSQLTLRDANKKSS